MEKSALIDLFYVVGFFLGGVVLAVAPIVMAYVLAPRRTRAHDDRTLQAIECGMEPIGPMWIRYGVVYYLYALIFVAFAVDVVFLFPVAAVYDEQGGWRDLVEVVVFLAILTPVIAYAWAKGVFTWKSKIKSRAG